MSKKILSPVTLAMLACGAVFTAEDDQEIEGKPVSQLLAQALATITGTETPDVSEKKGE